MRKVFALNLILVGAPILLLGALATPMARLVLGPDWAMTGQIVTALSFLGGAQALATPFSEATSIFSAQHLRFLMDGATATFVVGALVVCGTRGVAPLDAIWLMSVGGAAFSIAGLALIVSRFDRVRGAEDGGRRSQEAG